MKPFELRRDKKLAKERLRITYQALEKHIPENGKELPEPPRWALIPKDVFSLPLSSKAYGLLVILAMNASTPAVTNGRKVVSRVNERTILRWLGLVNSNRRGLITELLDELSRADIIKRQGEEIELLFPVKAEGGFAKIYATTYQTILDKSHGINTLNRLAVYLGIRARIFEGKKNGPYRETVYKARNNDWVGELVNLPPATVRNGVSWLVDHEIMAWNLVQNRNEYHNKHYYLAEHFHRDELFSMICGELKYGELLRVLA